MIILLAILATLAIIFISFVFLVIYLAKNSSEFKSKNEQHVRLFIQNYSETGDINSVYNQLTNSSLMQLNTPEGIHLQQLFKRLGKLVAIRDFELSDYKSSNEGKIGVFLFKAKFENAETVMNTTVIENNDSVLIHGLFLDVIGELRDEKKTRNHFLH